MLQIKAFLVALPALFLLALKAGLAIGATGTLLEVLGDFLARFPKLAKFGAVVSGVGRKLEAWGSDAPKFVDGGQTLLAKLGKVFGIGAMFVVLCLLQTQLTACTWFTHSVEPIAKECAPSEASLVVQVSQLLLSGGDYAAQLDQLAVVDGAGVIECAVKAAIQALMLNVGKVGANSEDGAAVARGKAYLAAHPGAQ